MPKQHRLYGLVGVFEDYTHRSTSPAFQTTPGIEYGLIKRSINLTDVRIVHDPYYLMPTAAMYGQKSFELNLAYLMNQITNELYAHSSGDAIAMHSVIDIYAEIMMNYGRQKWLEPLVQKRILAYDRLFYVAYPIKANPRQLNDRYDAAVRRIMHDFRGSYYGVQSPETLNASIETVIEVDRIQAVADTGNPETNPLSSI